ncbi:MAG: hypothetical protein ACE5OZ_08065 [Candidatus Heimdallarchaeota archaeon]
MSKNKSMYFIFLLVVFLSSISDVMLLAPNVIEHDVLLETPQEQYDIANYNKTKNDLNIDHNEELDHFPLNEPQYTDSSCEDTMRNPNVAPDALALDTITFTLISPLNNSRNREFSPIELLINGSTDFFWYSWNATPPIFVQNPGSVWNTSFPSFDEGIVTLEVWANLSVSPFTIFFQRYNFLIDNHVETPVLVSPLNNSNVPSWTELVFSFPEPLVLINILWDGNFTNGTLMIPEGNGRHNLDLEVFDEAMNSAKIRYSFTATLNLRLSNNLINETQLIPGAEITIELSDIGTIVYSWDGSVNSSVQPIILSITEGDHLLDVYGEDPLEGFVVHYLFLFTTDGTAPVLALESGQQDDDEVIPGDRLIINYTEELQELSIAWREDPQYSNFTNSPPPNRINWSIPAPGGLHHLDLFGKDLAGNSVSRTFTFHVLVVPRLGNLANNSIIDAGYQLAIDWTDAFGETSSFFSWDGGQNSTYLKVTPYGSGYHDLIVYAQNQELRWSKIRFTFQVLVEIMDIVPISGSRVQNNTGIAITWSPGDDPPTSALYSWDGQSNSTSLSPLSGSESFHELIIWARGTLGYWKAFHFNWTIDETPLTILLPDGFSNESAYSGGTELAFNTNDNDDLLYAEMSWDGSQVEERWDKDLNTTIPYSPAHWHELEIWVYDHAGNEAYAKFLFASLIEVLAIEPANGSSIPGGTSISMNLTANPKNSLYEWNNSVEKPVLDAVPILDGVYELKASFQGFSGHWNNFTFLYYVDNIAPQPILWGVHGPIHNGSSVLPNYPLKVTWSDDQVPISALWSWDDSENLTIVEQTPFAGGNHTLRWWLVDSAGNENNSGIWVFVDKDSLTFSLAAESPKSASSVQSGVSVGFTASEIPFLILTQWNNEEEVRGWENITTPTEEGNWTLSVHIADEAGHWFNRTYWWTIDNSPPPVFLNPSYQEILSHPWRNGTIIDISTESQAYLIFAWDNTGNQTASFPTRNQTTTSIQVADGDHLLIIYATDPAGNANTTTITVAVDTTPFELRVLYPQDGETKDYTVWATVQFSEKPYAYTAIWAGKEAKSYWKTNTSLKVKCQKITGKYKLEITASDAASNNSTASIEINMIDDPLPLFLAMIGLGSATILLPSVGFIIWHRKEKIGEFLREKIYRTDKGS